MADIQNLEVVVEVNITDALASLTELQDELSDLADDIERVDARGAEGIDIDTHLDQLDTELAALEAEIEAFEQSHSIDLATDVDNADFGRNGSGSAQAASIDTMNVMADRVRVISGAEMGGMGGDVGGVGGIGTEVADGVTDAFDGMDMPRLGSGGGGKDGKPAFHYLRVFKKRMTGTFDTLDNFKLRMSDMHNILASLIPVLLVFIGAIPAAITALVTLAAAAISAAAALAVIGGLGAMGFAMQGGDFDAEKLKEALSDVTDSFLEAFAPLAERLQPLFEDALDGLEKFFQAIANEGEALMALTDEVRNFGKFMMDFVPMALRTLGGLVEAMSGIFGNIGQFLQNNFTQIVRTMVRLTAEIVPALSSMADKIMNALPALMQMSHGFLMVASAVIDILGLFSRLLGLIGMTPGMFGLVTASLLGLASAIAIANLALKSFVFSAIAAAIKGMYAWFASTLLMQEGLIALAINTLANAIVAVYGYITSLIGASGASLSMAAATMIAAGALAAFLTLASLGVLAGLAAVAMGVASQFLGMADGIDSATSSLKDFNRVSGKTGGGEFNPYGGANGAPRSGSAAPSATTSGGGSRTSGDVFIESSGDKEQDKSNATYASWRQGRTSGSGR